MNFILFDDHSWDQMLPLTFTRPVSDLRIGILKIREKWQKHLNSEIRILTREYLREKFPVNYQKENTLINSCLLPSTIILNKIKELKVGEAILHNRRILAIRLNEDENNRIIRCQKQLYVSSPSLPPPAAYILSQLVTGLRRLTSRIKLINFN